MKKIEIYTDGACSGNPGPGGYGAILKYGDHVKELSAGYKNTTNNRMEMRALIAALESLKESGELHIYSDSKYIVDALNQGWAKRWRANGWMRNKKDPAQNIDLWDRLLTLLEKHNYTIQWVKGHAGHPENERCDTLAVQASRGSHLLEDRR
ncbi:MAG: ribonuclease HI [Calditrichaeota bacterium]|nr:MAG: ribonuclease HI [Calditrichota bacterium]